MATEPVRTYADACVFGAHRQAQGAMSLSNGGAFDEEFATASSAFNEIRGGRHILVTSTLVRRELQPASDEVGELFADLRPFMEVAEITSEAGRLQQAYLDEGIVTQQWADDALHVAIASVARCPVIVSWNFRHIVHRLKIPLYNAVNTLRGYPGIAIHSPREVIEYEE